MDKTIKLIKFLPIKTALLLVVVVFFLTGCYESEQEIISASDAQAVSGLAGTYAKPGDPNEVITITAVPNSNGYRVKKVSEEGMSYVYIRAIHLRGNIYIFQLKVDDQSSYSIFIVLFKNKEFIPLQVDDFDDVYRLGRQYGVKLSDMLDELDGGFTLSGYRTNILSFLKAHKNLDFYELDWW